jgi:hypothetical protein
MKMPGGSNPRPGWRHLKPSARSECRGPCNADGNAASAKCASGGAQHATFLAGQMSADYIRNVPTTDLPEGELAAVIVAIRGIIEGNRHPHAPRLNTLRAALARFDAATARPDPHANKSDKLSNLEPTTAPAKADKQVRR